MLLGIHRRFYWRVGFSKADALEPLTEIKLPNPLPISPLSFP